MESLISRENLIKSIGYIATPGGIWAKPFEAYKEAFKEFVEGMPDVGIELKIGKWKWHKSGAFFICTNCEKTSLMISQYCPNCGAKMSEILTDSESEDKE